MAGVAGITAAPPVIAPGVICTSGCSNPSGAIALLSPIVAPGTHGTGHTVAAPPVVTGPNGVTGTIVGHTGSAGVTGIVGTIAAPPVTGT